MYMRERVLIVLLVWGLATANRECGREGSSKSKPAQIEAGAIAEHWQRDRERERRLHPMHTV
jgi:hypothetical protein